MTVAGSLVVLVNMSEIYVTPVAWGLVKPETDPAGLHKAVHVKSVPDTLDVSVTFTEEPEHIWEEGGLFDRSGMGLTVTV